MKHNERLKNIMNVLKFFVMTFAMSMGFGFFYTVIWIGVGLPQTWWAMAILLFVSLASTYGWIVWVDRT